MQREGVSNIELEWIANEDDESNETYYCLVGRLWTNRHVNLKAIMDTMTTSSNPKGGMAAEGLGNPLTVGALYNWCWRECPNIIFVMEMMMNSRYLERIRNKCGFTKGLCVSSRGRSGGLGLWWRDLNAQLVSYNNNHIMIEVLGDNGQVAWRAVGVYGWPEIENKHKTWHMFRQLCNGSSVPMVCFGDFNEILSEHEKGGAMRRERHMNAFREALDDCGLQDMGFYGNSFIWQRGRMEGRIIRERLDRAISNLGWNNLFPGAEVHHYPIYASDHAPIIIKEGIFLLRIKGTKRFKFETFWLSDPECSKVVNETWSANMGLDIMGKITACSADLSKLAKYKFGDIKRQVKEKEKELERRQRCPPSADMLAHCQHIGMWQNSETWFANVILDYFHVLRCVEQVITPLMNENLNHPLCDEEIKRALFAMHPHKAPGPDGLHAVFYQKHWDVMGRDIFGFLKKWWEGRRNIYVINNISVVLIPKCSTPRKIMDFRPISLCNVLYKIISKTLANRLKSFLNEIIMENQSSFTPGRLITDNALIAFEIFHAMKRRGDGKFGNLALKLNMRKAYDRVEWGFLAALMRKMGFTGQWGEKVLECVTTVSHSHAVDEGNIHAVRVCRVAPRISNLSFADDSILFARANIRECSTIADVISKFEKASSQKINYSMSEIAFNKKVNHNTKEVIKRVLGVREAIFVGIKERIWKKIQGWRECLSSKPGKEVC
ncbi:hypothetical protein RND81_03G022700 [Saponaria officinalis]|uniref:Reverse transcriptase domain-containing protein n=1 Tax=Saponaria officinalis TaxID=3572 RepID=A0AAW1M308_SAPOF